MSSCNFPKPKLGNNGWEICLTVVTVALFFGAAIEFVAFDQYKNTFKDKQSESCCGVIEFDDTRGIGEGGICKEEDFLMTYPKIPNININGSVFCLVNGTICDEYQYTKHGNIIDYTLGECLNDGGYDISDICGEDVLKYETQPWAPYNSCIIILWLLSVTFVYECCAFWQCFSCVKCKIKTGNMWVDRKLHTGRQLTHGLCVLLQLFVWLFMWFISNFFIEDVAQNEYGPTYMTNEVHKYLRDSKCGEELYDVVWTEYTDLDIPKWLNDDWYEIITVLGIILNIIGFGITAGRICCRCWQESRSIRAHNLGEIDEKEMHMQFGNVYEVEMYTYE